MNQEHIDYASQFTTEDECLTAMESTYGGRGMQRALSARLEAIRAMVLDAAKQQYKIDNLKEEKEENFSMQDDGSLMENTL